MFSLNQAEIDSFNKLQFTNNEVFFSKLLDYITLRLEDEKDEVTLFDDSSNSQLTQSDYLNMAAVAAECIRTNSTDEQIRSIFSGYTMLTLPSIDQFLLILAKHRQTLTRHCSKIGIGSPRIVGLDWRLDYAISSTDLGRISEPLFALQLQVQDSYDARSVRTIEMLANREELQHLLTRVREAVKQVDRDIITLTAQDTAATTTTSHNSIHNNNSSNNNSNSSNSSS